MLKSFSLTQYSSNFYLHRNHLGGTSKHPTPVPIPRDSNSANPSWGLIFNRTMQARMTQAANLKTPGLHSPTCYCFRAPRCAAEPIVRNTVCREPLGAEKDGPRESPPPLKVPRDRTKQVLMNSGPKSGGVVCRRLGRSYSM